MTDMWDTDTFEAPTETTPMFDLGIERATLGSAIAYPDTSDAVFELVRSSDFYEPKHQLIAETLLARLGQTPRVDATMLPACLLEDGVLDQVGGATYIVDLMQSALTPANAAYFAEKVVTYSTKRQLYGMGLRVQQISQSGSLDIDEIRSNISTVMHESLADRDVAQGPQMFDEDFDDLLDELADADRYSGLSTGLGALDDVTDRLRPGQLVLIAGRPGMGKSVLGFDIARHVAFREQEPVLFVSLEMSRRELQKRLLSAEGNIPLRRLTNPGVGGLTDAERDQIDDVRHRLGGAFLAIDDSPQTTLEKIRSRALRQRNQTGLSLLVIDYLQLMSTAKKHESRVQEVSEISRGLKLLAKELEIPIIALSQLNRGSEVRADKRPAMSDMRESGSLEQDADIVILLHREDYYDAESRPGEIDITVAKNRGGTTGAVLAAAQFHKARIFDIGLPPEPPDQGH